MKASIVFLALVACAIASPVWEQNGLSSIIAERGLNEIVFPSQDTRIVGGQLTTVENFPWMVSLQRFSTHRCGASLIRNNRMLTAAHCTDGIAATTLQIRAATSHHASGGNSIQISWFINHPQYNPRTIDNDITVMHTGTPFIYSAQVAAIPMPAQGAGVPTGAWAQVAGWGHQQSGGSNSAQLRYVSVPIVDQGTCNAQYSGGITAGMLCAGVPQGGIDACQNDSGGPLTLNGLQVGVVSWGNGCARPNFSGVYARVAFYRNWINSQM